MISFLGPSLEEGPLPGLVYFALSKEESLYQDPYNQPILHLQSRKIRLFSVTLPAHGPGLSSLEALSQWAKSFREGNDFFTHFIDQTALTILQLVKDNIILPGKIGLMGLSRGGFIAGHLVTRLPIVAAWLAFAPLTKLSEAEEFLSLKTHPLIQKLSLEYLTPKLAHIPVRFYIGNRDVRVGTRHCFDLVEMLTNHAFQQGLRSPPIELIISPSIGRMGHGTSKSIFCAGADWIADQLEKL